jgi:SHS2 domain-containing protein
MVRIESHTADVRLQVQGGSIQELFEESLKGLYEIMEPVGISKKRKSKKLIKIAGSDKTVLLIDFLNEVLSESLIHKFLYQKITLFHLHHGSLEIHLEGQGIRSFTRDVKAVTFHEAEVIKTRPHKWRTKIILDI